MTDQTILQETLDNNIVDGDWLIYWKTSTGVQRRVARSSLLGATLTGAGTIATGGFTLTVPATGTAALRAGTPVAGNVAQWDDANTVEDAGFAASNVALLNGTRSLTADWDIGDNRRLLADGVRARDGAGLRLEDDAGNLGVTITSGGNVGIGAANFPVRETGFGYNSISYKVLQLGYSDTTFRSVALNIDPSSIVGGTFSGRGQILIPKDRSILAPNNAGSDWGGVLRYTNDLLYLGGSLSGAGELSGDALVVKSDGNVGIGTTTPGARLEVDQASATANIPTLHLRQADDSEEFIRFEATVGAGNAIDTAALGTYYGKIRVHVDGVGDKFIGLYNT